MAALMPGHRLLAVTGIVLAGAGSAVGIQREAPDETEAISQWAAPPYWVPPSDHQSNASTRQAFVAGPTAVPFISLFPCRLVDTRAPAFPAPLGGGFLPPATVRSYTLTGVCNVPANAQAISLNATVVKPTGPGFLTLWPQGGAYPPVSTLNFLGNDVIVNAAVVPLSAGGGISMALGVSGGDVILDTNGYYAPQTAVTTLNGASGDVTLAAGSNVTLTPSGNTLTIAAAGGSGGGPPSGAAGGSLTGTYPNPTIAAGAVGNAQLGNAAVTDAKVAGPIAYAKLGGLTSRGVTFGNSSGTLSQDAGNFSWDSINHRLGLGKPDPTVQLELAGMMKMPDTAASSGTPTAGVLFVGADHFLHNYAKPGSGGAIGPGSTFVGQRAGNFTMGGPNTNDGSWNTGVGFESLRLNTAGSANTAVGVRSLHSNTEGHYNSAVGLYSLSSNTKGSFNTAVGQSTMYFNTTASRNTAIGASALANQSYTNGDTLWSSGNTAVGASALVFNNPTASGNGIQNTAVGDSSLLNNTIGFQNTALGWESLASNTTGFYNTAVGLSAGNRSGAGTGYNGTSMTFVANTTGNYNTFVGHGTGSTGAGIYNCTAVGIDAYCDGNDQVRLGNVWVTSIGGQVGWSALSDARAKTDIRDLSLGLDFVLGLRPVEYRLKLGDGRTDMGFLAQDVEALLGDQYGVVTVGGDPDRTLSLRYTDLIAPLVKAIQEQQALLEARDSRIQALERELDRMKGLVRRVEALEAQSALGSMAVRDGRRRVDARHELREAPVTP